MKFKNAAFITALTDCNYSSIPAFSKASGISYQALINYANLMTIFDNTAHGDYTDRKNLMIKLLKSDEWTLFEQYRDVVENKYPKKIVTHIPSDKIISIETKEMLQIESPDTINDNIIKDSLKIDMADAINKLHPREQDVLRYYYGMGCKELNLDEIAKIFNLKRERTRQILEKALRKLRHRARSDSLAGYVGQKKVGKYILGEYISGKEIYNEHKNNH